MNDYYAKTTVDDLRCRATVKYIKQLSDGSEIDVMYDPRLLDQEKVDSIIDTDLPHAITLCDRLAIVPAALEYAVIRVEQIVARDFWVDSYHKFFQTVPNKVAFAPAKIRNENLAGHLMQFWILSSSVIFAGGVTRDINNHTVGVNLTPMLDDCDYNLRCGDARLEYEAVVSNYARELFEQ